MYPKLPIETQSESAQNIMNLIPGWGKNTQICGNVIKVIRRRLCLSEKGRGAGSTFGGYTGRGRLRDVARGKLPGHNPDQHQRHHLSSTCLSLNEFPNRRGWKKNSLPPHAKDSDELPALSLGVLSKNYYAY